MISTHANRRAYGAVHLLFCAAMLVSVGGCLFYPYPAEPYRYVYKLGGPKKIAAWTLEQTEAGKICDGISGLGMKYHKERGSAADAVEATEGLDRIHDKLVAGWPELIVKAAVPADVGSGPLPVSPRTKRLEGLFACLYDSLAGGSVADFRETARAEFYKIKPPLTETRRLESWMRSAERFHVSVEANEPSRAIAPR